VSQSSKISNVSIQDTTVLVRGTAKGYAQEIVVGPYLLHADEPVASGGTAIGPSPYDFVLAALGACTSMTVGMYVRRKNWPLEGIVVRLRHSKVYADDCSSCDTKEEILDQIDRELELVGPLSDEQRMKLLEIARKCPVHRTLKSGINIRSQLA
jgi:putative redox protein